MSLQKLEYFWIEFNYICTNFSPIYAVFSSPSLLYMEEHAVLLDDIDGWASQPLLTTCFQILLTNFNSNVSFSSLIL